MDHFIVEKHNTIRLITFNRPQRKNAITVEGYLYLTEVFNRDAVDDSIITTIITGNGEYFSSGNDLSGKISADDLANEAALDNQITRSNESFKNFVFALLNYPKLIIAVVNGPAIGIAVTMLPLCDVVYASDRATFSTPFVRLGLVAEACSSFTLQNILGKSKACEMLYLGHKMTAEEAYEYKLISKIIPQDHLHSFVDKLKDNLKVPLKSIKRNKALVQMHYKHILCECNLKECAELKASLKDEDFINAMMEFFNRKHKL